MFLLKSLILSWLELQKRGLRRNAFVPEPMALATGDAPGRFILVPGSAWNPRQLRLLPPHGLQMTHNEAEPLSIGIPG